jgi:hypothetical protein
MRAVPVRVLSIHMLSADEGGGRGLNNEALF